MKYSFFYIFLILGIISCEEPRDIMEEVNKEIIRKERNYRATELKKCFDEAQFEAETYVDSMVAVWVAEKLIDTIEIPEKPIRPSTPSPILGTIDTFSTK